MFQNFFKWVLSFFYTAAPAAARVAGRYIAVNNRDKIAAMLPLAETALAAAKDGQLDQVQMRAVIQKINEKVGDPELLILLSLIEIPSIETGVVNGRVILILEAFIEGCKTGV